MAHNNSRDHNPGGGPPPTIPSPYDPPQHFQRAAYSALREWRLPPPGQTLSSLASEPAFGNRFRTDNNTWRPMATLPVTHPINLHVVPQVDFLQQQWSRPPFLRPDIPETRERSEERETNEEPGRPHRLFGTVGNCEQAVHQHFEESFRIAQQKGFWRSPLPKEDSDKPLRLSMLGPGRAPILTNQPGKYETPKPRMDLTSPRMQTGRAQAASITTPRMTLSHPFSHPSDNNFIYHDRSELNSPPVIREPDRALFPGGGNHTGKVNQTPQSYVSNPAHTHRIKVSSPAPPQIYGKPGIPTYSAPSSVRNYDIQGEVSPLSLTSKMSTRPTEAPPLISAFIGHQNQVLKNVSHYMFNNSIMPGRSYIATPTPPPQILATITASNEYQTQPLDLGGKRKSNSDPITLNLKKVRNDCRTEPMGNKLYYSPGAHVDSGPLQESLPRKLSNKSSPNTLDLSNNDGKISQLGLRQLEKDISTVYKVPVKTTTIQQLPQAQYTINREILLKREDSNDNLLPKSTETDEKPHPLKVETELQLPATEKPSGPTDTSKTTSSYSVHKLKKAWIERLTGEDAKSSGEVSGNSIISTSSHTISSSPTPKNVETAETVKNSLNINSRFDNMSKVRSPPLVTPSEPERFIVQGNAVKRDGNRSPVENSRILHMRKKATLRARSSTALTNGHDNRSRVHSSSDSEPDKAPAKRPRPKGKRKPVRERKEKVSGSMSESAKDSDESRDGDTLEKITIKTSLESAATAVLSDFSSPSKKRGRKAREAGESPTRAADKNKKSNPFKRLQTNLLKKTGESFLQDGPCSEVAPKLGKCRECRWSPNNRSRNQSNIFCRFYAFRKLRYTKNGIIAISGFSDPTNDPTEEDSRLWLPSYNKQPKLEVALAKFLIFQLGDQFCHLIHQEKEAQELNAFQLEKSTAWKRVVQGVREMCDVCDTTLFNFHWACAKCGFVVCITCYKNRRQGTAETCEHSGKDRDNFKWLLCSNRQGHEDDKLMLTQAIPVDAMTQIVSQLHKIRGKWKIPQQCHCEYAKQYLPDKWNDELKVDSNTLKSKNIVKASNVTKASESEDDGEEGHSTLRELLVRPSPKGEKDADSLSENQNGSSTEMVEDLNSETRTRENLEVFHGSSPLDAVKVECDKKLKHFVRPNKPHHQRKLHPVISGSLFESLEVRSTVPHSWLCDGKVLRLHDPNNQENHTIFQEVWKLGQPAVISNVSGGLNQSLWSPESFSKDFGDLKSDFVDVKTGMVHCDRVVKEFWDGFDDTSKRDICNNGQEVFLKLTDWPAGEDFAEVLPSRFKDLMAALPLRDYTHRNGRLNLVARLPENFVKPDTGPKMCIAYGSGHLRREEGTINLHFDMSDVVNILVHVSLPKDCDNARHKEGIQKTINESECDVQDANRITYDGELPGALWHVFNARDADKIRDLLNKVSLERGKQLDSKHDSLHDPDWYIDATLRRRLVDEYEVTGYSIVQYMGDAILIPAGAPYQVRNLQNCINVSEDFVSPESISHCFYLTEEFQSLSASHANHEDKLQVKSVMYHAVKDSLSVLSVSLVDESFPNEDVEIKSVEESNVSTNNTFK